MPRDFEHDEKIAEAMELRAGHIKQIEALTKPGLSAEERIELFAEAAGFNEEQLDRALDFMQGYGPTNAVWYIGRAQKSIFANLPDCGKCPTQKVMDGQADWEDIPRGIDPFWCPAAEALRPFSRVQIEERTGVILQ